MELLAKIANSFQLLTIFAKISVLHVSKGSQYASETICDLLQQNRPMTLRANVQIRTK